jgi:hypothetical protein
MMTDLLPHVEAASSEDENDNDDEIELRTGEEGEVQIVEPPEVKRHVPENEVFPALDVRPVAPKKKKRTVSKKQLEHLARCRQLAADKRAAKPKPVPKKAAPTQSHAGGYSAADMEHFAGVVLDKYRAHQPKPAPAPQTITPVPAPVPAPQTITLVQSREDEAYEFWSEYF